MAQLNDLIVNGNSRFISRASATGPINQIITGTGTAASSSSGVYYPAKWTFNTGCTATNGDTITIKMPTAGHDYGVYVSIDNGTNYYPVIVATGSRLTTHYPSDTYINIVFDANTYAYNMFPVNGGSSRVTVSNGAWRVINYYDSGNDTGYYTRKIYSLVKAGSNKVFPYTLVMECSDGRLESIVTSSSTGTTKSRNTHGFRLGQIYLMYQNSTYNENVVIDTYRLWTMYSNLFDHRYSFNTANDSTNGTTANKPVYLKGTINASDGLFYLDTTWWTQTLPTTADGKFYIYLGDAYDYYRMTFSEKNTIYHYVNGAIREYIQDAGSVNGFTVEKSVPSNAVFTDNNTTYTLGTNGNNVTLTPSDGSAQSITVPYSTLSNTVNGVYTGSGGQQGPNYFGKNRAGFLMSCSTVAGDTHYKNWLYMDNYNGNDVGGATAFGIDRTEPRAFIMQSDANRTTWNNTAALGVFTATPTSGQVVTTDGTTGGIKSSGYTIAKSVPSDAKFTDNNTTYTFANGTNGFTVTPSGGSAQTVTVTPSISNNVTGSGTSGYLTKFNGANTVTNGPQLGSDTTKFLRNDGSWATPAAGSDVNVTQTATSTSANYEVLFSGTADNTTRTEGARKNNNLTFNPSTGLLTTKHLSALSSGSKIYSEEVSACTTDLGGNWYPTVTLNGTSGAITATTLNGTTIGSSPKFTDANVTQTETSTSDTEYSLLFSGSQAGSSNKTEGARKDESFTYNPYNGTVTIGSGGASYITLSPYGIETPSMSVSDISSLYTPSKTSGNWSIGSDDGVYRIRAYRTGNVVQLAIIFHGNGSAVSAGTNGFVGSISDGALPIEQVTLTGFYSSSSIMAVLDTDGSLTVRPFQNTTLSSSSRLYMTGTFICP